MAEDGKSLKVDLWFGNRECIAAIRSDASLPSTAACLLTIIANTGLSALTLRT